MNHLIDLKIKNAYVENTKLQRDQDDRPQSNAKQLKDTSEYRNVFIGPDLTLAQRIRRKQVIDFRDEKNSSSK